MTFSLSGFAAPWWFLLLLVVAAVAVAYALVQRRRRRALLKFANLSMLERVAQGQDRWRRHLPAALLLVALLLLTVALAGPTAEQKVPRNRASVMLVIDVSRSMKARDVEPSRLAAAQSSAAEFAQGLPETINLGLVSFAGTATVQVAPTTDRSAVTGAIENLRLADATATGEGIYAALSAIRSFGQVVSGPQGPPPGRIVLMTDGKQTQGRDAFKASEEAKKQNVPVSGISFGTEYGTVDIEGEPVPVPVDDDSVRRIADLSGGEFYKAASAEELREVYRTLGEQIGYETERTDASKSWLALGTLIALVAVGSGLVLTQRLP